MSRPAADELANEGIALFEAQRYLDAITKFERAVAIFPAHEKAWKGLGHSLLCLGRVNEGARAFDRAVGLRPDSATALWGGALAHAEAGNRIVSQNYLRRALQLQPSWIELARGVPHFESLLSISSAAGDAIRRSLGAYAGQTFRHAEDEARTVEVGRITRCPSPHHTTYVSIGIAAQGQFAPGEPHVELALASTVDREICGQIVANTAFHVLDHAVHLAAGVMLPDVIGVLGDPDLSVRFPHIYLMTPRSWRVTLPLSPGPPALTLLQLVPISRAEAQEFHLGGAPALERLLTSRGTIDLGDLMRRSLA